MNKNAIYEEILKKSKDGFLKIVVNEDKDFVDFEILDYNDTLINIIKAIRNDVSLDESNLKDFIKENFPLNKENIDRETFFKKVKENKLYSLNFFIKEYNQDLTVDAYNFEDYVILIVKFDLQNVVSIITSFLEKSKIIYFWIKDKEGKYVYVNNKYLQFSKFNNKHQFIGNRYEDLDCNIHSESFFENERDAIETRIMKSFRDEFTDKDGKKSTMDVTIWPLQDINYNIATMGLAFSENYRKEFYRRLEENEETFKEITKYCDSAFFIRDNKKILYASPSYEEIFEESPDYLIEDVYRFNDLFINEEQEFGILGDYSFDKVNGGRAKATLRNGKEKWIWYKFLPIFDEEGNAIKRIGILTDVTNEIVLEDEKEKLRLDFFANISHELRTPVNLVLSCIQVLKLKLDKLDGENYEYFSKYIEIMQQNGFRLLKLINNLIDSTKIDTGSINIKLVNSNIVNYVEDICTSVVPFIRSKDMDFVFDTTTEEEIVAFDPDFIERILLNLLSNAVKFNKDKKTIYVDIDSDDEFVKISVRDEGIGIPEKKLKTVFERFEQVDSKMKGDYEGSGIGLYLVKSLVEMHEGTVEAISKKGEGTSIEFKIPKKTVDDKDIIEVHKENIRNNVILEFSDMYSY